MATTVYGGGAGGVDSGTGVVTPAQILAQLGAVGTPSYSFEDDPNTGFYRQSADKIGVALAGAGKYTFASANLATSSANGPSLQAESASVTNPTLCPNVTDPDTGIGWVSADLGAIIAGATDCIQFGETGSAPTLGFYGTTAVAQPTGVAVTAGGVHAALVTLGLITA